MTMEKKIEANNYVEFGRYYNNPILWKCMKKDNNGFLLVSEYILCLKAFDAAESGIAKEYPLFGTKKTFGSSEWKNSNIREWLNSKEQRVSYSTSPPTKEALWKGYNAYDNEPGFLSNFDKDDIGKIETFKHNELKDKIFLLSEKEIELLFPETDNKFKRLTKEACKNNTFQSYGMVHANPKPNERYWYWLRSYGLSSNNIAVVSKKAQRGLVIRYNYPYYGFGGIVPALYLKTNKAILGNGSITNPYSL